MIGILVPSLLLVPSYPVHAQSISTFGAGGAGTFGGGTGVLGNVSLGGLATTILGCAGGIGGIKDFFGGDDLPVFPVDEIEELGIDESLTGIIGTNLAGTVTNIAGTSVPTHDAGAIAAQRTGNQIAKNIKKINKKIQKEEVAANNKETCLDAIAFFAAKELVRELGVQTIAWINNGFQGQPLFLENPQSFFENLYKREVNGLVSVIGFDPINYPFGAEVAASLKNSITFQFERNARFTLNEVLLEGFNHTDFNADFRVGGWGAWLAMTLLPQNNPIGFRFITAQENLRRTRGTRLSLAEQFRDELNQGNGFLSTKLCVLDKDNVTNPNIDWDDQNCARWANATPGQTIAHQANITLGSKQNQLELADELNEVISAMIDALLNQLIQEGLSQIEFTDDGAVTTSSGTFGGHVFGTSFDDQGIIDHLGTAPEETLSLVDELPTLIQNQLDYVTELNTYNTELGVLGAGLRSLDYCIPGPTPTWFQRAQVRTIERTQEIASAINGNFSGWEVIPIIGQTITEKKQQAIINITTAYNTFLRDYAQLIANRFSTQNIFDGGFIFVEESITEVRRIEEYDQVQSVNSQKITLANRERIKLEFLLAEVQTLVNDGIADETQVEEFNLLRTRFIRIAPQLANTAAIKNVIADRENLGTDNTYIEFLNLQCTAQTAPVNPNYNPNIYPAERRDYPGVGGCFNPIPGFGCTFLPNDKPDTSGITDQDSLDTLEISLSTSQNFSRWEDEIRIY